MFVGLAFVTAAGLIFEDIGALIEVAWDVKLARKDQTHSGNWWTYLCKPHDEKLPALHYLRFCSV